MATTVLKPRKNMKKRTISECHGGVGDLECTVVLTGDDTQDPSLKFCHDDILLPGASIGDHLHTSGQEYYLILSGKGIMTLDGREYPVEAGDIGAVYAGGTHGLRNTGDESLRFLVMETH